MLIRSRSYLVPAAAALLAAALPMTAVAYDSPSKAANKVTEQAADKAADKAAAKAEKAMKKKHDLVATAVADGRFTILAQALTDTGLVEALQSKGPFTVFAPTDAAFAKLPEGTLASLDTAALKNILLSHVVVGKIKAKDAIAADGTSVEALSGAALPVAVSDGVVSIKGAQVTAADVKASNGIIHVIDTVILPD